MYKPRYWRPRECNERLIGYECQQCGYVSFPEKREICKQCTTTPSEWNEIQLQEEGVVQSYVVQQRLSDAFEKPLPLGVIDMPQIGNGDPARVFGLFTETEPDDLEIGKEVVADFREIFEVDSLPVHSYKFKLARVDQE